MVVVVTKVLEDQMIGDEYEETKDVEEETSPAYDNACLLC